MRLKDKVALITGGGSGIGRETALLFGKEGAKNSIADLNESGGWETIWLLERRGGEAGFVRADVSAAADAEAMIAAAEERLRRLNILFNNAGIMHSADDDAVR